MRVLVTGADGFLGWHVRARLQAFTSHEVVAVSRPDWDALPDLIGRSDAVIHLAGVNRGGARQLADTNLSLAYELADAIQRTERAPRVIYANSVQAGNGTPYGDGKAAANSILAETAIARKVPYTNVVLPNLFGEGGRPDYNSFVATFVDRIVTEKRVDVSDNELELLHAQDAAKAFVDALREDGGIRQPSGILTSVAATLDSLVRLHDVYRRGEIPILSTRHEIDLLNTLRERMFPVSPTVPLTRRADERGALVEAVRAHGSAGQTFISTTKPGITRGEHFHLRKLERFAVVDGRAEISLRRLFSRTIVTFLVTDEDPVAIDMPTGWTHKITNVGERSLTTVFWTNELFNPEDTDTYPEEV